MTLRKAELKIKGRTYHLTGSTSGMPFRGNLSKSYAIKAAKGFRKTGYPSRVIKRSFGYLAYSSHYGRMPRKRK